MDHLLFAAYLILFSWLVTKIPFFKHSGLTQALLVIIFLLKVMAGIFYGWIGIYYGSLAQMVDTWLYHMEGLKEYHLLLQHPKEFFTGFLHSSYAGGYSDFLSSDHSWWNDIQGTILIKVLALFNIFSFGNYYVNVIFYSFITLFGPVAMFKVMQQVYSGRKTTVLLATFFIPSFIYWTSGIHKEGLIFLGLALFTYEMFMCVQEKRIKTFRVVYILSGFLIVVLLRNFLVVTLLPAIIAWLVAERLKTRIKPFWIFGGIYVFFVTLFFVLPLFSQGLNFPQAVAAKQQSFLHLQGESAVPTRRLEPTFFSFLKNAPQALSLTLLRPYPSDVHHLLSLAASVETFLLLLLILLFLFNKKLSFNPKPVVLFCIFFSLSVLLTIGYTVNFLGAIVRYRSIFLPLLFVPVIAQINWSKIQKLISGINNNYNV